MRKLLLAGIILTAASTKGLAQNVFCGGSACSQPPAITMPGNLYLTGTLQNGNVPGLVLYNSAGYNGTSMSIDFYDYTVPNSTYFPQARIQVPDSGDYSGNIIFLNKVPGNTPSASANPLAESMRISSNGSVGIGTSGIGTGLPGGDLASLPSPPAPNARILEVNGIIALAQQSGGQMIYSDGTVQSTAWNGVLTGGDYAESVNVSGDHGRYEPGDVLVIDPNSEGKFLRSSTPYSIAVTGIYSTKPGVVGRRQLTARAHMKDEVPMAMTGIVPTKVSAENGAIKPGDLLVTSSTSGYAMKGTERTQMLGAVIGKAIGHLDSGTGIIEVVSPSTLFFGRQLPCILRLKSPLSLFGVPYTRAMHPATCDGSSISLPRDYSMTLRCRLNVLSPVRPRQRVYHLHNLVKKL